MELKQNNPTASQHKILTIPNILSFFRICLIPLLVWLYRVEEDFQLAGYVLILSGVTDIVDGFIARHFNMISDFGKVLDPIADKLTQAVMLICLLLRFPLMAAPFILLVAKELFMSVTGLLIIRRTGIVLGANWHGKVATCLLYATMFLHIFWEDIPAGLSAFSIFCCTGTILMSFVLYAMRNFGYLRMPKSSQS